MYRTAIFIWQNRTSTLSIRTMNVRFNYIYVIQDRNIHMAESDFDTITQNGVLCNDKGEIGWKQFEGIMRHQITLYMQTQLTNFSSYRTSDEIEFTQARLPARVRGYRCVGNRW